AFVVFVGDGGQLVIDAVYVILNVIVANVEAIRLAVRIEHSEVAIEGTVLLQHEDHVVHRGDVARRRSGSRSRSWRGGRHWRGRGGRHWRWRWRRSGRGRRWRCGNGDALGRGEEEARGIPRADNNGMLPGGQGDDGAQRCACALGLLH